MMVCGDVSMSAYKIRHPDDTDDPPDVSLSSDDEATGMEEQIGIAWQITVSHPERSVPPSYSQGRAASPPADDQAPSTSTSGPSGEPPASFVRLGPDEVVIRKAVLCGIKRGAELALKGKLPASFLQVLPVLGTCLLLSQSRVRMRSTAHFVGRIFPWPKLSGGTCACMRESWYMCAPSVQSIWRAGQPWRCTRVPVAARTIPTTVGRATIPSRPCCNI